MCPDLCVITVKKTSILVPSLTQQNKGVQPDCLKLLELPSQRVGYILLRTVLMGMIRS